MAGDVDDGVVCLLLVPGFLGWVGSPAAAFVDAGVGAWSSFVEPFEGFGDVTGVYCLSFPGGKIPRDL
jgi:hypothetical protein